LWSSKVLLLVEGKDVAILKRFQNRLFSSSETPIDGIPNMSIGGWGGWSYVVGSSFFLKNAGGDDITTYCLLDSDYFSEEQIAARYAEAKTHGVQLHILQRKEIENYLVVASAVRRVIAEGCKKNQTPPTIEEVEAEIDRVTESLREEIFDNLCTEFAKNKALAGGTANKLAREKITKAWATPAGRLSLIPGKQVISKLSDWSKKHYDVSFGPTKLANSLSATEIDAEIKVVIEAVENREDFPPRKP
jgi:hypothetical protein